MFDRYVLLSLLLHITEDPGSILCLKDGMYTVFATFFSSSTKIGKQFLKIGHKRLTEHPLL
jgi:hypothetical protein